MTEFTVNDLGRFRSKPDELAARLEYLRGERNGIQSR
jgi:hypothetical protein